MKGIKVLKKTNKDGIYCSGGIGGSKYTEFEVGKTYKLNCTPQLCEVGYHFFKFENYCFGIDYFKVGEDDTVYVEIEALGDIISDTYKSCTNSFKIIRIIPKEELIVDNNKNAGNKNAGHYNSGNKNAGNDNSGNKNSGNKNSGNDNSGHYNSGHYNSGNKNSGNWNKCNNETGFFNNKQPKYVNVFNKKCEIEIWEKIEKPDFIYFVLLPNKTYEESFIKSFKDAKNSSKWSNELMLLENLPNFDWKIFEEISGISKEMAYE